MNINVIFSLIFWLLAIAFCICTWLAILTIPHPQTKGMAITGFVLVVYVFFYWWLDKTHLI